MTHACAFASRVVPVVLGVAAIFAAAGCDSRGRSDANAP